VKRRELITLLGTAIVARPSAAGAQPASSMRRIGYLAAGRATDTVSPMQLAALTRGLRALGWIEGQNIQLDIRRSEGDDARFPALAEELVALNPEVIIAVTPPAVVALKHITQSIPIVFTRVTDPVGQRFVSGLARPGRNITGFADFPFSIGTKWLQLLREVAPRIVQVALLYNPVNSVHTGFLRAVEGALKSARMSATELPIQSVNDFQRLAALAGKPGIGVITVPDGFTFAHRAELAQLAARNRLPTIYGVQGFTTAGGLISYAPSLLDPYRRAASYVDRILRGEKPADLPVQYPTKYELSINLKAAKALGLAVPPSLLIQADEVLR